MKRGPTPTSNYGRSCATCVKAKCRCVPRNTGNICERCYRLNKTCAPAGSNRYQGDVARLQDISKMESLESKVEQLFHLVQDQQQSSGTSIASGLRTADPTAALDESTSLTPPGGLDDVVSVLALNSSSLSGPSMPQNTFSSPSTGFPTHILPCAGEPSISQAEEYFHTFRTRMLRFFPIVNLTIADTSQKLRKEKPFLWLAIMAVACNSTPQQLVLGESVKAIVAREMICRSRKDKDLLLGLLIFTAWGHYQHRWMAFLTDLIQLAMSLVFDLGLNRPPNEPRGSICFKAAMRSKPLEARPATATPREKTMEERRAVLGCYLVSSMASVALKRIDGLRWTKEMDASLQLLCKHPECPGDTILAIHVKLQLLVEQVDRTYCTWPFGNSLYRVSAQMMSNTHIDALVGQLQLILVEASPEIAQSDAVLTRYHCTRLLLNEALLSDSDQDSYMLNLNRIKRYDASMDSIKSWFDLFLNTPSENFIGFTFLDMCSMAYNVLVLVRFTTTPDPVWHGPTVRKTVDIIETAETIAEIYQHAADKYRVARGYEEIDFFTDSAKIFQYMARLWKQELGGTFQTPQWFDDSIIVSPSSMEWDNDSFWLNMLSYSSEGNTLQEYETPETI